MNKKIKVLVGRSKRLAVESTATRIESGTMETWKVDGYDQTIHDYADRIRTWIQKEDSFGQVGPNLFVWAVK